MTDSFNIDKFLVLFYGYICAPYVLAYYVIQTNKLYLEFIFLILVMTKIDKINFSNNKYNNIT